MNGGGKAVPQPTLRAHSYARQDGICREIAAFTGKDRLI